MDDEICAGYGESMAAPWTVVDIITVAFGCATIILACVAIGIGALAWFAYRDIKSSVSSIAERTAKAAAEAVAIREFRAYMDQTPEANGGVVEAYQEAPKEDPAS